MRRSILLLSIMAVMVASYAGMALGASQLTNGGFETGDLSGWSVDVASGGNASAVKSYTSNNGGGVHWTPKEGSYFALLTPGAASVDTMISQPFSASNGDKVSGWVFFQAEDYSPYDDKGQVLIKDESGTIVAKTFEESVNTVGSYGNSGWRYWEHTFTGEGTFRIEARVHNLYDGSLASRIGLDDVKTSGTADTTDPVLTLPGNITEEATGPNGAAVSFTTSATDEDPASPNVTCDKNSGDTFPIGTTTVNCSATDAAGNEATASFTVTVRDTTAPNNVSFVGGINDGASFLFGDVPAKPTCTADDAVGVDSCVVSGYSTAVGTHTLTATALDAAGNRGTKSITYEVKAWTLKGFYAPVDMGNGVINTAKNGSTVPLKFEVLRERRS